MSDLIEEFVEKKIVEDPESIKDKDLWSLDGTLAKYMLPRLVAFRDRFEGRSRPQNLETSEEWVAIQNDIIYMLEYSILEFEADHRSFKYDMERVSRGEKLLGEYFLHLWD